MSAANEASLGHRSMREGYPKPIENGPAF
jgi:hypothetical protein